MNMKDIILAVSQVVRKISVSVTVKISSKDYPHLDDLIVLWTHCEPIAATGKGCFLTEMIGFTLFYFSRSIPDSLKKFFKGEL